jgi:hypothetical protein
MGDRRYGAKSVEVAFLGEKAWFPFSGFAGNCCLFPG